MEELYEKIEAYLNGELPQKEREAFEKQLGTDAQLGEEMKLFEQVRDTIRKRSALEEEEASFLKMIQADPNGLPALGAKVRDFRRRNLVIFAVAAALALVLVSVLFWGNQTRSGPELYAMYVAAPSLPKLRDTEGGDCREGVLALENGAYSQAVVSLEKCLEDSLQGLDVRLALAYAYMNVDESKALPFLEEIDKQRDDYLPAMKYRASWYLVLMGVKLEDWKKAKSLLDSLLENKDLPAVQREQAEELQKIIEDRN